MQLFEVVVIGGGVIGCAIARELARAEVRVTLFERGRIGGEASGVAAGVLGPRCEIDQEPLGRLVAESGAMFPELLTALESESGLTIAHRAVGTLAVCFSEADVESIDRRSAWQKIAGCAGEWLAAEEAAALETGLNAELYGAYRFADEWWVDAQTLALAYARGAEAAGCAVHEEVPVTEVVVDRDRVVGVESGLGRVACEAVINAAGAWAGALAPRSRIPVFPVRGQTVVLGGNTTAFSHTLWSPRGMVVSWPDGQVAVGSTVEHGGFEKRVTAGAVRNLIRAALEIAPALGSVCFEEARVGLRPGSPDGLPIVGCDPAVSGYFVAAGHGGFGVVLAPITAQIVGHLLHGVPTPWRRVVGMDRFRPDPPSL